MTLAARAPDWRAQDAALGRAAEAVARAAREGGDPADVLHRRLPWLLRALDEVRACPAVLEFWGRSSNRDENAAAPIVDPAVLKWLGTRTGAPLVPRAAHAGVLHTYGYLLSSLETPYGLKRDRWVRPGVERGLRLAPGLLRARPPTGSLLFHVTWFLWALLHRGSADSAERDRLGSLVEATAPGLRRIRYRRFEVRRILETAHLDGVQHCWASDFVRFPAGRGSLLVYSVREGDGPRRLVTAFPMGEANVRGRFDEPVGKKVPLRLRYNAVVAGLRSGRDEPLVTGRREHA